LQNIRQEPNQNHDCFRTYFLITIVRSTTETSGVGTLKAMPVNFPLRLGITFPTAFAAPVDDGMMF